LISRLLILLIEFFQGTLCILHESRAYCQQGHPGALDRGPEV
jgi:hypothetical protein